MIRRIQRREQAPVQKNVLAFDFAFIIRRERNIL